MDDDELTPEQRFAMDDPADKVHFDLAHGKSCEEIHAELVRFGWTPQAAKRVIDRAAEDLIQYHVSPESRRGLTRDAKRQMVVGIIVSILGACVGVLALLFAMALGGIVLIPWGVVVAGVIMASRGYT